MTRGAKEVCKLCGHARFRVLYSGGFDVLLCRHCGLIFVSRSDRDYRKYYSEEYSYRLDETGRFKENAKHNDSVFKWVNRHLPEKEDLTLVEVGCNAGFLLKKFRDRGIDVYGIEPNREAVDFARGTVGVREIECCVLDDVEEMDRTYDVVLLIQTFEHLPDPLASLLQIKGLLAEDGLLFIEVPNFYSPTGFYLHECEEGRRPSPNHLFVYTPATLKAFLAQAGFSICRTSCTLHDIRMVAEVDGGGEDRRLGSYHKVLAYYRILPIVNRAIDVFRAFKSRVTRV